MSAYAFFLLRANGNRPVPISIRYRGCCDLF